MFSVKLQLVQFWWDDEKWSYECEDDENQWTLQIIAHDEYAVAYFRCVQWYLWISINHKFVWIIKGTWLVHLLLSIFCCGLASFRKVQTKSAHARAQHQLIYFTYAATNCHSIGNELDGFFYSCCWNLFDVSHCKCKVYVDG